jgi:hypothetical protein
LRGNYAGSRSQMLWIARSAILVMYEVEG